MKNSFKIGVFTLLFALTTVIASAQSTAQKDAMVKTEQLQKSSAFEMEKFKSVYAVYFKHDLKLESINESEEKGTKVYTEAVADLNKTFKKEMKAILNEKEFNVFVKKEKL